MPTFEMGEERGYLSVRIPIHPDHLPNSKGKRALAYEASILAALDAGPLSLTELASALGYKGISKKLRDTVEGMVRNGTLTKVAGSGLRAKLAKGG